MNDKGQLIAAGHPKVLDFVLHERNPRGHRAPSEAVIFLNPTSSKSYSSGVLSETYERILGSKFETLLLNEGELLSASTIAGIYKNKLLVGGLLDHGLLLCPKAA